MVGSQEEYLIAQIDHNLKINKAAAKCWMIFAKSAYPQSFTILFQLYKMECEENNVIESAECLSDLVQKFPNEKSLIMELRNIAKALCSDSDEFSKNVFEHLPEEVKYNVMISVSRNTQSVEEHCELMLLFLKRMPSSRLLQHGINIIDTLMAAEDRPGILIPINLFRKMLVCDALPLILHIAPYDYKFKVIFKLMQKAIEFYVCCMFTFPTAQDASIRKDIIVQSDTNPDEGWKALFKLIETVGNKYRWNYPEMFVSNFSESSLQQLLILLKRKNKTMASLSNEKTRREDVPGPVEGPCQYFLMEGIAAPQENCPTTLEPEFKHTERGYIVVSMFASPENSSLLTSSFVTAVECWEMLHHHQNFMKEFKILCKNIQLDTWPAFQEFYINMLMYERAHRDAIEHLSRVQGNGDMVAKNKTSLQIASCYYFLGEYKLCLKLLFDVILNLQTTTSNSMLPSIGKCPARFLYFMGYNNKEILQYCVSVLLKLHKCKENVDETYKDATLGYMLVLMQYDVEQEFDLLNNITDTIRKKKSFCFPKFFKYIINVHILEQIAHLATPVGGSVKLDILPNSTCQVSKQRAVTRGVNKGARDDLKQAFVNQMARSYDDIDNLFIEFLKEEINFLLLPFNDSL
ncbi:integrator complex subunit 10 [Caerostris darwini]|uniref:Integrator complex subunit 10 n=1 Tax=Caerostris darwini TaxID=1538125 RepID=A0AAV4T0D7_9ARAC|nr:integrator complex subunit 10 [Caerostris darwini]